MSRADAIAALAAEGVGLACGVAWLPPDVLDVAAAETESVDRAEALAAVAASIPVDLAFVDGAGSAASDAVATLHSADVAAVWAVDGVFGRVAALTGWSEALRMTVAEPAALSIRLDEALHEALVVVRRAFELDADAVLIGDDLAGPAGPLLPPDYALDALMPCYHRLAIEASGGGLSAVFHSDGDIRVLMPALAKAGFSAVHLAGLGPEMFAQSAAAARRVGLVVLGGIQVQALAESARDAGEHAASVATSLGGVIICDDGGITTFEELTAFGAAIDSARDAFRHPRA